MFFTNHAFGYHCYSRRYSEDIRFFEINGKRIYTLFIDYFSGEVYNGIEAILLSPLSLEEHVSRLDPFVTGYPNRVTFGRSHLTQLSSLLNSINWIGLELPEEETYEEFIENHIDARMDAYSYSKQRLERVLNSSLSDEETDWLLYIQVPFWVKLLAERPDVLNRIKIVHLENVDLYNRAINLTGVQRDRIDARLSRLGSISDEQMSFLRDRLPGLLPGEELESQELETILGNLNFEEDVVDTVRDFVDWSNNWIINTGARADFIFRSILKQEGNGIVISDRFHRRSLEDRLHRRSLEDRPGGQACLDSID